jgi:archaellum biogenesis protein FlaJ (TadC family)
MFKHYLIKYKSIIISVLFFITGSLLFSYFRNGFFDIQATLIGLLFFFIPILLIISFVNSKNNSNKNNEPKNNKKN